jgi:cystathionine beta-lyase
MRDRQHRDTRLQHHGDDRELFLGSAAPPVFRTSLFTFPDCKSFEEVFRGEGEGYLYSRVSNPTVRVLEKKVADLEMFGDAIAFSSGMGAISAVLLAFLESGSHLICLSKAYAPTLELARGLLRRLGVEVTFLSPEEVPRLDEHIRKETRLIYVESPASLTFDVIDLELVGRIGQGRGIPTATDNSWASPLFQQPSSFGIDLSVHSGTKYIAGHSDILLGMVAGKKEPLDRVRSTATLLGASLSPEDAFLAVRGLRTLHLRMKRHEESAFILARRLLVQDRVADVLHPALPFFPTHARWKKQFSGSSGLFSFRLRGDARRFADALKVFRLGVSWGGFESLVLPSVLVSSGQRGDNQRPDVPEDLIRLSVGLEDVEDLWEDLERGLKASVG